MKTIVLEDTENTTINEVSLDKLYFLLKLEDVITSNFLNKEDKETIHKTFKRIEDETYPEPEDKKDRDIKDISFYMCREYEQDE